ncbi:MAG: alpha/beta fold hydrolase [Candidatus Diapherotrites archaeon]|nr:alpha/beta fold hydrolase [Candidatus Diapherotrites archaeon]
MHEKLFFESTQGIKLCGILADSKKDFSKPLIIFAHGFGSSKDTRKAVHLEKVLGEKGFPFFRFDFTGHKESQGNLEATTLTQGVQDLISALKLMQKKGYKKFGLIGESFGTLCSVIASTQIKNIQFLVLIAPLWNYQEKAMDDLGMEKVNAWKTKGTMDYTKHNGVVIQLKYDLFDDAEKNNGYEFAPKITVPVLIIHGAKDTKVSVNQSKKAYALIKGSKLEIFPESDHYFLKQEELDQITEKAMLFVQKHANL